MKVALNHYAGVGESLSPNLGTERKNMSKVIAKIVKSTKGASAVEYALIIALIAAVIGVGIAAFGSDLNAFFSGLFDTLGL